MSQTSDNPGGSSLLSTLLPSVMLLASGTVTGSEHDPGDGGNYRIEKFVGHLRTDSAVDQKNSAEEIELLFQASPCLTTSTQSSENEFEKNYEAHHSFLAGSLLFGFLLFPSLLENKKYEATVDYHESCHLQTSALSKLFPDTIQTFKI